MTDAAEHVERVFRLLREGGRNAAEERVGVELPFDPPELSPRGATLDRALGVFLRDGFIDRYSGDRLVFPGALRLLSHLFPEKVPYHPNWKAGATHPIYWSLHPTVDHIVPLGQGGRHEAENCVTTSMLHNSAKGQWTLAELGWTLVAPGSPDEWDGLMGWFCDCLRDTGDGFGVCGIQPWHRAALRALRGRATSAADGR